MVYILDFCKIVKSEYRLVLGIVLRVLEVFGWAGQFGTKMMRKWNLELDSAEITVSVSFQMPESVLRALNNGVQLMISVIRHPDCSVVAWKFRMENQLPGSEFERSPQELGLLFTLNIWAPEIPCGCSELCAHLHLDASGTPQLQHTIIYFQTPENVLGGAWNLKRAENDFYYNFLSLRALSGIITTM